MHASAPGGEPLTPSAGRQGSNAAAVRVIWAVVFPFSAGAGPLNANAGHDDIVDRGIASVLQHDVLPDIAVILRRLLAALGLFEPTRDFCRLAPFEVFVMHAFCLPGVVKRNAYRQDRREGCDGLNR